MPDIGFKDVRQDCVFFRGAIPCVPNKTKGAVCTCSDYRPVEKRILIIKLGALGDVIRTTPLVVRFRKLYPDCHITWLTLSPGVLPANEINLILTPEAFSLYSISHSEYDIAINLDKDKEACQLLANVSAGEKYGYSWQGNEIVPATPAAVQKLMTGFFDQLSISNTKSYLEEIFEICHLDFQYEPYLINRNAGLGEVWKSRFRELAGGKIVVGLNTGCGPRWNTRLWPEEYWMQLGSSLKEAGLFPVFLGGTLEHEKNDRMAGLTGVHYPGTFSLEEFIALTDATDVVVTQVSMMMHIATALQKKMVLMNNIFNRHEFELYGRGVIVEPSKACECYFGNNCVNGQSCMHELSADSVFKAVRELAPAI